MQKAESLIRTKLHLPFARPGLVARPHLQARIAEGVRGPLMLIVAPAGFGKTTLIASSIAHGGMPVAWLSLDENDNQIWLFLSYLAAALHEVDNSIGSEALQLLAASQQATPETVLTSLINDIDANHQETVLVLDDFQFISSPAVHEKVVFLLEHCPKVFHLVIATRSDPPLPLARLRARGQLDELRTADLRFSESEAVEFLNNVMGFHLDPESITALEERTEGWIAGLQMAALSLRDREDVTGFVKGFSGTNRFILDYLLDEVLAGQPPEIQHFLLYTSILERLTAPLCDAIAGIRELTGEKSAESLRPARDSRSILEYLERTNLFLVPLDDERIWYRYHHLFADLLRAQLQKSIGTQGIALVHLRASEWCEQNGSPLEAIHHASLAADLARVERLIEQNYMAMAARGEMSWMRFWTDKLSKELVYSRPLLCIYRAQSQSWFGQLDEADELLVQAEKLLRGGTQTSETNPMLGHVAYIKSRVTAMRGDVPRAIDLCLTARENTAASNQGLLGGIGVMLGYAYYLKGDFAKAVQALTETIQLGITAQITTSTVAAYCVQARLYAIQGKLRSAFELYQKTRKFAQEVGGRNLGVMGVVEVGIADVLCEWNDLDTALKHMKQGMEFIPYWSKADDIALAYMTQSRIHQARGHTLAAVEAIEKGSQVIHMSGVFPEARDAVATAEIKLRLAQGNSLAIGNWMKSVEKGLSSDDPFRFENELAQITLARIYLSLGKLQESIDLLSSLEAHAQSGGRMGRLIGILILKAMGMQKLGEPAQALELLAKSLALAEPEGYIRIFVEEGIPMRQLLAQWLAHASASPLRYYANHLLSVLDSEAQPRPPSPGKASSGRDLVEPLSPREVEVLHLMALGRTNQEIADILVVARGTIKAQAVSIYRKLDVANRTEAVARARQLGILP